MREKYERIALKNQEELKLWHEAQVIHLYIRHLYSFTTFLQFVIKVFLLNSRSQRCRCK